MCQNEYSNRIESENIKNQNIYFWCPNIKEKTLDRFLSLEIFYIKSYLTWLFWKKKKKVWKGSIKVLNFAEK